MSESGGLILQGMPTLDGRPLAPSDLATLGPSEVAKLRGRFALAVRRPDGGILLARDGTGLLPLYYHAKTGVAAMRAMPLLAGAERSLDAWALAIFTAASHMPSPRTMLSSVRKCPPGVCLEWSGGSSVAHPVAAAFPRTRAEAATILLGEGCDLALLDRIATGGALEASEEEGLERWAARRIVGALRRRLRDRRRLLLSGGIDSSILASLASREAGSGGIETVTFDARPSDPGSDGAARAEPIARLLHTAHTTIPVTPEWFMESLEDYVERLSEPTLSGYLYYLASRHLGGSGPWVSGLGADELFFGDPFCAKFRSLSGIARHLSRVPLGIRGGLASVLRRVAAPGSGLAKKATLLAQEPLHLPFLYAYVRDNQDASERLSLLAPEIRPAAFGRDDANFPHGVPDGAALDALQEVRLCREFPDGHGRDVAQLSGDVELDFPFLDSGVVAAALVVRPETRLVPPKRFLREAVSEVVPAQALARAKGSFLVPPVAWLRGPLHGFLRDRLAPARLERRGIWNVGEVARRFAAFQAGHGSSFDVIRVLLLELWMDRHAVLSP